MKILAIGDMHGKIPKKLPKDVDLILLVGDIGKSDMVREISFENLRREKEGLHEKEYSKKQKKKAYMEIYNGVVNIVSKLSEIAPVYLVYGNVESHNKDAKESSEWVGARVPSFHEKLKKMGDVKIINNKVVRRKFKIGGVEFFTEYDWLKRFEPDRLKNRGKGAKKSTDKVKKVLKKIGKVDILVCHQPPYGVLDKVKAKFAPKSWKGKHAGSKVILDYIKKKQPEYVFCGHIHEGKGIKKIGKTKVYNLGMGGYVVVDVKC